MPEEPLYLSSLDTECDILFHSSDDYHDALAAGLQDLLRRYPGAEPEARETAEKLPYSEMKDLPDHGVICIDTGCGKGGCLTAMIVEDGKYILEGVAT